MNLTAKVVYWWIGFVIFNSADAFLTIEGMKRGYAELNSFWKHLPLNLMMVFKTVIAPFIIAGLLRVIWFRGHPILAFKCARIACFVFVGVTIWNTLQFIL